MLPAGSCWTGYTPRGLTPVRWSSRQVDALPVFSCWLHPLPIQSFLGFHPVADMGDRLNTAAATPLPLDWVS